MSGQDRSPMFGMELDSPSAPNNPAAVPGNEDAASQQQQQQQQQRQLDSTATDTSLTDDTRSFFPTDTDWAFEAPTEPTSLYQNTNQPQTWADAPQSVPTTSIFPAPLTDGLPSASQAQTLQSNNQDNLLNLSPSSLTQDQRDALRMIAMPHLPLAVGAGASQSTNQPGSASSPDPGKGNLRKRKSSADIGEDEEEIDEAQQPVKKTAHNMIEKRYRTNLNDKIAALRDSVPSLRIMSKSARGEDTTEDREELHGLTPAHKLNKATVLSKATEYIRHLEKRNNRLQDENHAMQQRIMAFEKLFMAGAMNGAISPLQQPPPMTYPGQSEQQYMSATGATSAGPSEAAPAGMIEVPEEMKRILRTQPSQPYHVPEQPYSPSAAGRQVPMQMQPMQPMQQQGRWRGAASPYTGKLMVGSLAGLM